MTDIRTEHTHLTSESKNPNLKFLSIPLILTPLSYMWSSFSLVPDALFPNLNLFTPKYLDPNFFICKSEPFIPDYYQGRHCVSGRTQPRSSELCSKHQEQTQLYPDDLQLPTQGHGLSSPIPPAELHTHKKN